MMQNRPENTFNWNIENTNFSINLNTNDIETVFVKILSDYDRSVDIVSFFFVGDAELLEVNREFLKHDYFTDIITFDYGSFKIVDGEAYISLDTVDKNSKDYGVSFENELLRVIFHGILHLCGLNDKTSDEEKVMREAENKYMSEYYGIQKL
ncbi:MAG: rRNA maturation RNase YbeY [Bacteroidales bacterium]